MKQFLKMFLASGTALLVFGLLVLMVVAISFGGSDKPEVSEKTLLTLNLGVPISDKPLSQSLQDAVRGAMGEGVGETVTLRSLLQALDEASRDERVAGLYLHGNVNRAGYYSGWAALKEVRDAIMRFKASGKPVIAYEMALDEAGLYMMTAADDLYMNPMGYLEFNGFAAQIMFFKGAFEKYGVDVQVTRVGKYKSAVEPYLLDGMSEANREQLELLLNDIFDETINSVAEARDLDPANLRALANTDGVLTAADAVARGIVNQTLFYDDVLGKLRELTGTEAGEPIENQMSIRSYYDAIKPDSTDGDQIALIYAEGGIQDGNDEQEVGGDHLARLLRKAREDEHVKAIVLRVNSPGGSALASDVIQRETRLIKGQKPIVVSMGTVAASGGYWISTYADEIFALPNTITGSIGVFGMFPNVQRLMNEHGINVDVAKTSPMADVTSTYRPKTDAELAVMQRFVDDIYTQFLDKVSEGRGLERDHVAEIAEGRVWSGTQALELGLIDKLGGVNDAIASAAARANLTDYQVTEYQVAKGMQEEIMEMLGFESTVKPTGSEEFLQIWRELQRLQSSQGIYARLPYELTIR
ncbi:MAG: signal peptide peptidase SppA [Acidobacteria bacterium]|nr:signal peptide peptidase SppA [Acidobacteriota bacterium]